MRRETMPEDSTSDDLDRLIAEDPHVGQWLAPRDDIEIILVDSVETGTLDAAHGLRVSQVGTG